MNDVYSKIIAVDFDGCLCEHCYPEIGAPIWEVINPLHNEIAKGARVILWTCRRGEFLTDAVRWCEDMNIELAAVNENLPELIVEFGGDTRKIFANEYWDDRAVRMPMTVQIKRLVRVHQTDFHSHRRRTYSGNMQR